MAARAAGGLRFHELRHFDATWLVSEGVPVNVVRRVMGHEPTTTTLDLYTPTPEDYEDRVGRPSKATTPFAACGRQREDLDDEGDNEDAA